MEQRSIVESIPAFLNSWNEEFEDRYPITKRMMEEYYLQSKYVIRDLSYALYDNNRYVGLCLVKEAKGILPSYEDAFFLSLLHVEKRYRKQHVATQMITNLKEQMKAYKKKRIYLGSDMDCFYPGVFVDHNEETHLAFKKMGFEKVYNSFNLSTTQSVEVIKTSNILLATTKTEKDKIIRFIEENFSNRWVLDCQKHAPHNFIYMKQQEDIIGFVRIASIQDACLTNGLNTYKRYDNLYAIGPLGIREASQHKGYGKQLVQFAIHYAFENGASDCIVDWTGLIDFYQKCGFQEVCDTFTLYEFKSDKGENEL